MDMEKLNRLAKGMARSKNVMDTAKEIRDDYMTTLEGLEGEVCGAVHCYEALSQARPHPRPVSTKGALHALCVAQIQALCPPHPPKPPIYVAQFMEDQRTW